MNNLDLFNKPGKSYLIYQGLLFIVGVVVIFILSLFIEFNLVSTLVGYFTGCLAITIGFLLIIYSANRILYTATEKNAKSVSLMYFTLRYIVYLAICGLAIILFNANILAIIIGMFSLKIIIYVDNILVKNGGGN